MLCLSSSTTIDTISAGDMALITYWASLSFHRIISTLSPASSLDTACTREPLMPTQAPTGSNRASLLFTATLARTPGSRAAPMISITFSPTSGTSRRKRATSNSGAVRLTNNCGPRASGRTALRYPRNRSPLRTASREIISSLGTNASTLPPKSRYTLPRSTRLTIPVTNSPRRS